MGKEINVGRRVKIKDDVVSSYNKNKDDWSMVSPNRVDDIKKPYKHGGNGYGTIIDYDDYKRYYVIWDNGLDGLYHSTDFNYEEDVEIPARIRWYKNGKLHEGYGDGPGVWDIGRKVKIRDDSGCRFQAYRDGGDGYGEIVDFSSIGKKISDHVYNVRWKDGKSPSYRPQDLEFIEEEKPGRIRWYNKGKLEEKMLNESFEDVGKKVKIRDDSKYRNQAYTDGGDGYGEIQLLYSGTIDSHSYRIKWNNGNRNDYRLEDFDIVDEDEDNQGKIRWYKKGKLEEKMLNESSFDDVGRRVKMREDSDYRNQAYVNDGNGYGVIIKYNSGDDHLDYHDHIYDIRWNNNYKDCYRLTDIEFVDILEEKPARIRWYKNGKLEEKMLNESHPSKEDVGKRVKMRDDSVYREQAYYGPNGDGYGVITNYNSLLDRGNVENHVYHINWNNGVSDEYKLMDIEFVDDIVEEKPARIRWYNKGKLEEGIKWYSKGKLIEDPDYVDDFEDTPNFITDDEFSQFLKDNDAYDDYVKYCTIKNDFKDLDRYRYISSTFIWTSARERGSKIDWSELSKMWRNII